MVQILLYILIALSLVLLIFKTKIGVAMLLSYVILIPASGLATLNGAALFAFLLFCQIKKRRVRVKPFTPFLVYFLCVFLIIPFQFGVPLMMKYEMWIKDFLMTMVLPIIIYNVQLYDPSSSKLFRNTLLGIIFVTIGYGYVLTQLHGLNPYQTLIAPVTGISQDMSEYYAGVDSGRLFGRISSFFFHPMTFGLFIGLSFIYIYICKDSMSKTKFYVFELLILLMAVFCGVRTALVALFALFVYFCVCYRNFKILVSIFALALVGYVIVSFNSELSLYLNSLTDVNGKTTDVSGSSLEQRIEQLAGAINEVSYNPLFGRGYGWTELYFALHGNHPVCLAFESLLFVVICDFGFIGMLVWPLMVFHYFKKNKNFREKIPINGLIIFYLAYSCVTGEYGYMKYFLLFYSVALGSCTLRQKQWINNMVCTKLDSAS
ncbi:MAG: O-antigen ligase family protein [Paludibacteraceae bacterium]|nr:O-antigen ligase family protein [Paludibacteraceae bacterium]